MCIYLLKMRDYFKWAHDLPLDVAINRRSLGEWIAQREREWVALEDAELRKIKIDNCEYDCFDVESINAQLRDKGLVYGAGYGAGGRPHFYLAELVEFQQRAGCTVSIAATEFARDIQLLPAMLQGNTISVRRDALARYIWEKLEEWQWHKAENAMARAMRYYDFEQRPVAATHQMAAVEVDAVILHELGELEVGKHVGPQWEFGLLALAGTRAERTVRAVRDILADCLVTLPMLLDQERIPSLHFYMANFEGYRKQLWPSLLQEYNEAVARNDFKPLGKNVEDSVFHWQGAVNEVKYFLDTDGEFSHKDIDHALMNNKL